MLAVGREKIAFMLLQYHIHPVVEPDHFVIDFIRHLHDFFLYVLGRLNLISKHRTQFYLVGFVLRT